MMMKKQVFKTDAFSKFAEDNLVLLELDFPRSKAQPEELKKQNEELAKQYKVEAFPTLILISPKGKELARNVGFLPGGPDAFIAWVKNATK